MTRIQWLAASLMAAGVTAGAGGVFLIAGLGCALVVLGVCLIALAILLGWE